MTPTMDDDKWLMQHARNDDGTYKYDSYGNEIDYESKQKKKTSQYDPEKYRRVPPPLKEKSQTVKDKEIEETRQRFKRMDNPISAWVARELTKPAYKGLMSIPDLPVALNNLILSGVNKFAGTQVKGLSYPSDIAGKAVDYITDGMSVNGYNTEDGIVAKGVEFGSSMLGGGLLAKGLKAVAPASKTVSKVAPWLGSTDKGQVTAAAGMGAVTQGAEDMGYSPVEAAGIGLGVGIVPSFVGRKLAQSSAKKHFSSEVYNAAKNQDLDLPRIAYDKSFKTRLATTVGEHSLYTGAKLKEQTGKTNISFEKAFGRNLDKSTTKKTLENQELNKKLYQESEGMLTNMDVVVPEQTLRSVKKAYSAIEDNALLTGANQERYLKYLHKLGDATMELQVTRAMQKAGQIVDKEGVVPVKKLIEQKQQLNTLIEKVPREEWALKEELKNVRNGVKNDIEAYANTNEHFKDKWFGAEKLYGNMEKRIEAEAKLGMKKKLNTDVNFDPKKISENYLNVRETQEFVRLIGGKENLRGFDEIVQAAKALPNSKVSSLATNHKIMAAIAGSTTLLSSAFAGGGVGIVGGVASIVGADILAHILSKKSKVIDKLAQYAKSNTKENAKKVINVYKTELGMDVKEVNSVLMDMLKEVGKPRVRIGGGEVAKSIRQD